jgi:hypothetical protein
MPKYRHVHMFICPCPSPRARAAPLVAARAPRPPVAVPTYHVVTWRQRYCAGDVLLGDEEGLALEAGAEWDRLSEKKAVRVEETEATSVSQSSNGRLVGYIGRAIRPRRGVVC